MKATLTDNKKSGIALIITLGLLAILLLLAFSYAVTMQTEHFAAVAHGDGVAARQGIYQAFTLAAQDIKRHVDIYPDEFPSFQPRGMLRMGRLNAYGQAEHNISTVKEFGPVVTNYVPPALWNDAMFVATNIYWFNLFHCGNAAGTNITGGTPKYGEFINVRTFQFENIVAGSCIVNCSGMLDANIVGRKPRGLGLTPKEIQIDDLLPDAAKFNTWRISDGEPTESYLEMRHKIGVENCSNLFHFSWCPPGEYWSEKHAAVWPAVCIISNTTAEVAAKRQDILDAFDDAGIDEIADQQILFSNLLDYTDNDYFPRDWKLPCQEAVPSLNEFEIVSQYECSRDGGSNYTFKIQHEFNIEVFLGHVGLSSFTFKPNVGAVTINGPWPNAIPPGAVNYGSSTFHCYDYDYKKVPKQITHASGGLPGPGPGGGGSPTVTLVTTNGTAGFNAYKNVSYTMSCPSIGLWDSANNPIDYVVNFQMTLTNSVDMPGPNQTKVGIVTQCLECLDARINWDTSDSDYWRGCSTSSMDTINYWTAEYLADPVNGADGDTMMYCANKPLTLVGELGYLVYKPWKTIRLFDPNGQTNYHAVLSTFCQDVTFNRGKVNPNTQFDGTLAACFRGMPIDLYPGDPATTNLFDGFEYRIATNISASVWDPYYQDSKPPHLMKNTADLGNASKLFGNTAVLNSLGITNEFQKEAILRNSAALFSPRQQVYTIILAASYIPDWKDNEYMTNLSGGRHAERRAVVVFWRDSWTGDSFIRQFKFIENEYER